MASDSEPESPSASDQKPKSAAPASAAPGPKKKKAKKPKPYIPRTEEEIDSPSKQTLGMLGILGIMTIVMWAFARGGCNYHPPKESRTPRVVTTADLAHDPKNAAMEVQQRWLTHNFDGALELASGNAAADLKADKAACDAACLGQRKALADKVLTVADVLDANLSSATVRVTSSGLPGGAKTFLYRLERTDAIWKATDRAPDNGVLPTSPADLKAIAPATSASAAPGVSAAPAVSAAPVKSAVPVKPAAPVTSAH